LKNGVATAVFHRPAGGHSINVHYNGDPSFLTTNSTTGASFTVSKASTTATVMASPSSAVFGQAVTITATVAPVPPGAGTRTGTVTFYLGSVGGTLLGTGTVNLSGLATFTLNNLPVGQDKVFARYNGDIDFLSSSTLNPATVAVS